MTSCALLSKARWALLVISLGLAACGKPKEAARKSAALSSFVVDVLAIEPRPFRETLFATGSLVAHDAVELQSERSGVVKEISFKEGKQVKEGEVLLTIDDSELQAQLGGGHLHFQ